MRGMAYVAAVVIGVGATVAAPGVADAQPQCQYGPNVTADCPAGCVPDASGLSTPCSGPLLAPLLPPAPPVRVGIGFGVGDPSSDD